MIACPHVAKTGKIPRGAKRLHLISVINITLISRTRQALPRSTTSCDRKISLIPCASKRAMQFPYITKSLPLPTIATSAISPHRALVRTTMGAGRKPRQMHRTDHRTGTVNNSAPAVLSSPNQSILHSPVENRPTILLEHHNSGGRCSRPA